MTGVPAKHGVPDAVLAPNATNMGLSPGRGGGYGRGLSGEEGSVPPQSKAGSQSRHPLAGTGAEKIRASSANGARGADEAEHESGERRRESDAGERGEDSVLSEAPAANKRRGHAGTQVDRTDVCQEGVNTVDGGAKGAVVGAAGRRGPSPGEEAEGTGAEHPLAEGRCGVRRKRQRKRTPQGNGVKRTFDFRSCYFCGHGANKAGRIATSCTEGCGRWSCKACKGAGRCTRLGTFSCCACSQIPNCLCHK